MSVQTSTIQIPDALDFVNDWSLLIGNKHPGRWKFSQKAATITEIARIPFENFYSAVMSILGYSYVDNTPTLHRIPPIRHPRWPKLSATEVECQGVKFSGQDILDNLEAISADAAYELLECEVTFQGLDFLTTPDGSPDPYSGMTVSELNRYVSIKHNYSVQTLERQIGDLKWAETASGGPTTGAPFPGKKYVVESHADLAVIWHAVPEEWITDIFGGFIIPSFIGGNDDQATAVGCVNSDLIFNLSPGTLLMKPPIIDRYPAPLQAQTTNDLLFYVDVTFMWDYFDPPLGATSPITAGHQTAPFFSAGASPTAVQYYAVSSDGTSGGTKPYNTTSFVDLFAYLGGN